MVAHLPSRSLAARFAPRVSATERAALAAGDLWIEAELFSGRPDWAQILSSAYPVLSAEERAFLDGPVEAVCALVDDWQVWRRRELPASALEYLKSQGFFGLRIPREYGGLGFSALAASAIFGKLASRSLALSTLVVIPNSVGPGELLVEHGTEEQKARWLPRLASGEEIPCFALTEPGAGSDASSMISRGTVFADAQGEPMLRLDFEKRYITLAPLATLIGLAFRLRDPENLLGRGPEPGITCALVPADTPGVEIGRRHDPLGLPLPNGPLRGRDVVVPASAILGGAGGAGRGWIMLMEALAGGRAISLPAQAVAGAKLTARIAGAWGVVRRQFGRPIAELEGVQEPLARIAGLSYLMEAARVFTCGAVDSGRRPAVASALVKHRQTELGRLVVSDGMDILAGAGISMGPRNLLGRAWIAAPVGITVEGANILTRTLLVFGQGLLRCHPWVRRELEAAERESTGALLAAAGRHLIHFLRNAGRTLRLDLSGGRWTRAPVRGAAARYWRRLAWASARFALTADLALFLLGAGLKARGRLSGRLADALSWMVFGAAALRRFEAEGRCADDLPLLAWSLEHALAEIQRSLEEALANFPGSFPAVLLRGPGRWWQRLFALGRPPSDDLGARTAEALLRPDERRERLTCGLFEGLPEEPLAELEVAFALADVCRPLRARIDRARREGQLPSAPGGGSPEEAVIAGVLEPDEGRLLARADEAAARATRVDEFEPEEYFHRGPTRPSPTADPRVSALDPSV